jgi:hypothetical protein
MTTRPSILQGVVLVRLPLRGTRPFQRAWPSTLIGGDLRRGNPRSGQSLLPPTPTRDRRMLLYLRHLQLGNKAD